MITELTGLTNEDLKHSDKFEKVFNNFWKWCCSQKKFKKEQILFITYGNFDKELFLAESKRHPKDNRLKYITKNIIDIQYILMMSMYGENNTCLSLLNATKYFCNDDTLTQDHNSLNDAKLLKKLYNNIGEPNIDNIIEAEKKAYVRKVRKLYGNQMLTNDSLTKFLKTKESLSSLTFDEIAKYVDKKPIEMAIRNDYWLLSEAEYLDCIFDNKL